MQERILLLIYLVFEKFRSKLFKKSKEPEPEVIRYHNWLDPPRRKSWKNEAEWYANNPAGYEVDIRSYNRPRDGSHS